MIIIKLIHPELGICAQEVVMPTKSKSKIIQQWKWKYGRKFSECTIEDEVKIPPKEEKFNTPKPVMFIKTGDIYPSVIETSRVFECSYVTVLNHCNRKLGGGRVNYRFKWAS